MTSKILKGPHAHIITYFPISRRILLYLLFSIFISLFQGDPEYANEVDKQPDDFCERGFKARNVFMNLIETPAEKRFGSSLVPSIGSLYEKCTKF